MSWRGCRLMRTRDARYDHHTTYVLYDTDTKSIRFRNLKFDFSSYIKDMEALNVELPIWLSDFT